MAFTTIDDPSKFFQTFIYTGNGSSSRALTNTGNSDLQPDWLWIKKRNATRSHTLTDSSRGFTKYNEADDNGAEGTFTDKVLSAQSDGFTVGDNSSVNANDDTYVAWQWKANGGTTTTNDASSTGVGSIDSVIQANTTAGFSIVTYTGTGSTATVAHGLGAVPDMLIFKKRSAVDNWYVYHKSITNDYYLVLDTTGARNNDVNIWNDTDPTSTVFSIANAGVHADGKTMVCYAFAEKQGYSKFGTYTGNGNAAGPFVHTGFKPRYFVVKRTDSADNWNCYDSIRSNTGNPMNELIYFDTAGAETTDDTGHDLDFLSNGVKLRTSNGQENASNGTYIYMAFAESPFVSSEGTPTTAK